MNPLYREVQIITLILRQDVWSRTEMGFLDYNGNGPGLHTSNNARCKSNAKDWNPPQKGAEAENSNLCKNKQLTTKLHLFKSDAAGIAAFFKNLFKSVSIKG